MTGRDLQQLLVAKWGYSFDMQIRKTQGKLFVLVMWRYLEQASFPLTAQQYLEHLNAIASYLEAWGCTEAVQLFIEQTKEKPRLGKAISIPVQISGDRVSEWMVEDS